MVATHVSITFQCTVCRSLATCDFIGRGCNDVAPCNIIIEDRETACCEEVWWEEALHKKSHMVLVICGDDDNEPITTAGEKFPSGCQRLAISRRHRLFTIAHVVAWGQRREAIVNNLAKQASIY